MTSQIEETRYYGTDTETYRLHSDGRVDVVSHETGQTWQTTREQIPAAAIPLSAALVPDVDWGDVGGH
jgi:hypothetical protein